MLCDIDTVLWLAGSCDTAETRKNLAFHCGSKFAETPAAADFVFAPISMPLDFLDELAIGTEIYPDRSCSVVFLVDDMEGGTPVTLKGPGIKTTTRFAPKGVPDAFWRWSVENHRQFPQGVDVFFASPHAFAALPRSTEVLF